MDFRYFEWDERYNLQKGKSSFETLWDLFQQLLTIASGEINQALKWLADLDKQYKITDQFDDDYGLGDFIEDKNALQPLDTAIQSNLSESTTKILASLTPREERVLRMRFGIGMNTDHTLEEVGLQFSVTRERIRQIEAKALRKLKHPSRSKQLKSFLEK